VLLNVGVTNMWTNIESFLDMESYLYYEWSRMQLVHSRDSEELFWKYCIIEPENTTDTFSLVGITSTYHLAKAGRTKDTLESIRDDPIDGSDGLGGACQGGHKELALLVVQRIESFGGIINFDRGLAGACFGGHKELALLMIEKGATDFERGLISACQANHKELVELMIQKMKSSGNINFDRGLEASCMHGHKELALLMIENGATNLNWGLTIACWYDHRKLVWLMIEKGATKCDWCYMSLDKH
jgi:hypothetical protein